MQILVNLQRVADLRKFFKWGEFLHADFSKSAVSGRFEKKSQKWGSGGSACRFQ